MAKNNSEKLAPTGRPPGAGTLLAIGGNEDKSGEMPILNRVVQLVGERRLAVATVASEEAPQLWAEYKRVFEQLGLTDIVHLDLAERTDADHGEMVELLKETGGVFFTGGDQLRITSKLGGTVLCDRIHEIYGTGGVIAGTSAGASVLTETMIVSGSSDQTYRNNAALLLSPGLGFMHGMVIDQHFAERGRIARLLGVVARNPRTLSIGIDENTAIEISGGREFRVLGAGAVYVIDGRPMTYTNVSEEPDGKTMSAFDMCLHVLSETDCFDLSERTPHPAPPKIHREVR